MNQLDLLTAATECFWGRPGSQSRDRWLSFVVLFGAFSLCAVYVLYDAFAILYRPAAGQARVSRSPSIYHFSDKSICHRKVCSHIINFSLRNTLHVQCFRIWVLNTKQSNASDTNKNGGFMKGSFLRKLFVKYRIKETVSDDVLWDDLPSLVRRHSSVPGVVTVRLDLLAGS